LLLVFVSPVLIAPRLKTVVPLNDTEIVCPIGKFDPVISSGKIVFHETTPDSGLRVIDETAEVKLAVAVFRDESVIDMLCGTDA